jgi:hypothetical protein
MPPQGSVVQWMRRKERQRHQHAPSDVFAVLQARAARHHLLARLAQQVDHLAADPAVASVHKPLLGSRHGVFARGEKAM